MLWVKSFCFSKIALFLKNMVSLCLIRSVHFVFRPIEIFKIWERESLSVSTNRGWFSTNRNSWIKFLKNTDLDFFKSFSTFSLSIRLSQGSNPIFCRFPPFFLQGFSLPRPVRPLYPSFCIYFHFSCIKSYIIWEISNLWNFWGFWWIKPFLSQLINGFLLRDVINMIFGV